MFEPEPDLVQPTGERGSDERADALHEADEAVGAGELVDRPQVEYDHRRERVVRRDQQACSGDRSIDLIDLIDRYSAPKNPLMMQQSMYDVTQRLRMTHTPAPSSDAP